MTSIIVDGFTGIIPPSYALTIDGQSGHTVSSTTQTTGNTTQITFTTPLVTAVADNAVVTATETGQAVGATLTGASVIPVSGFTGKIPNGASVTVAGHTYTVLSTVETLGNTTSITITAVTLSDIADTNPVVVLLTGAINKPPGYIVSVSSIIVDGFTGIVPVGARFKAGFSDAYKVTSTTESGGNTILINFTPPLLSSVADNSVITVYGVFITIKVGEGQISWDEKRPMEYKKDRGKLDLVRLADEEPMDVNFTLSYTELTASDPSTDPPTPEDALKRRGAAANWVSANIADPCSPYCLNIRLDWTPPNCPSFLTERVILPQYYYESLNHDPKAGTITTTGKCNATQALVSRLPSS